MAEFVLRNSEEMLPEFEQMRRVGLFSDDELKSIIKKTRAHEYKLVRRVKEKKDLLAYIQYEIHLLALINKRRKRINYLFKKDEIEYAIVARIHRLFKKCTFRWPEDLKLWLSHIEFCKAWNKKVQLSKIWTSLLQIHGNTNLHLWAMAAKWELEDNHSVDNARGIFLRGIRHHPEDPKLWQEYFRMELIHTLKLRQRLALLKEGEENEGEDTDNRLLNGEAARIIYNNAIQSVSNNCECKCGFLDIALPFSYFAGELINFIIEDITENHVNDPQARGALARLHINPNLPLQVEQSESANVVTQKADAWSAEKRCWEDFESAVKDLDSPEMWSEYFSFLYSRIHNIHYCSNTEEVGFEITGSAKNAEKQLDMVSKSKLDKFLEVSHRAHSCKKLTPKQYIQYVDILVKRQRTNEAINTLKECAEYLEAVDLKIKLLELTLINSTSNLAKKDIMENFYDLSSLQSEMDCKQNEKFWNLWFEFCKLTGDEDLMMELVQHSFKFKLSYAAQIPAFFLNWYAEMHGLKKCLEMYKEKMIAMQTHSAQLIKTMINLLMGAPNNERAISECFEEAAGSFGSTEPGIWLEYIKFMTKEDPSKVGNIYWRAMKFLNPDLTEKFVADFTLLQAGKEVVSA